MSRSTIDLNADVGESFGRWQLGDDAAMIAAVSSANVACGFHAGDPPALRRACELAAAAGVRIGAQVGYRDLAGFGRRFIDVPAAELRDDVLYQLGALSAFAAAAGTRVRYLKPHGALYHACVTSAAQAGAVVDAVLAFDPALAVLAAPASALLAAAAAAGLATVAEGFADRGYRADATLLPRDRPGAVLTDVATVTAQAVRLARHGEAVTADGDVVAVLAGSLCLHGDTPGAAALAVAVRGALAAAGVDVRPFC
jgi:5-oxoprolinase (ATP-hydrolysing) subunit A